MPKKFAVNFALLSRFSLEVFDSTYEFFEESVRLFYSNLTIPEVPEGNEPFLDPISLELPSNSLSTLCEILDLPNEGDHAYLSVFDKLSA